jgi:hypothetical protein
MKYSQYYVRYEVQAVLLDVAWLLHVQRYHAQQASIHDPYISIFINVYVLYVPVIRI